MTGPRWPALALASDFLPFALFVATSMVAADHPAAAAALAGGLLPPWPDPEPVAPAHASLLLAAAVALVAAALQLLWRVLRRRDAGAMPLVNVLLVGVAGGAVLWFRPEALLRWQPSILCWTLGLAMWLAQALAGRNVLRAALGGAFALPDRTWHRLNFAWVAFFAAMGLTSLWAGYTLGPAAWDDFKHVGLPVLTALFLVLQAGLLGIRLRQSPRRPQ